jgi:hypothetical protein
MPTNFTTFLDRDDDAPPPGEAIDWLRLARRVSRDFAFTLLRTAGFTATTVLMALGLPLFAFLALVGWDMSLLFGQLDSLATRFVAAEPARRLEFAADLKILFAVACTLVALVRLPRFVDELVTTLAREPTSCPWLPSMPASCAFRHGALSSRSPPR